MKYTCLKMATFGGVKYRPGDVVEAEMIQPGRARAMQDMGIIAECQELEVGKIEALTLPITAEGGVVELDATPDAVVQAVCILQQRAEEAVAAIAEVEDQSVLILVNACDSRKSVKAAAKERGVFLLEDEAEKATQEAPEGGSEGVS